MASNRNRTAGNKYEVSIANRYNSFGFNDEKGEFAPLFPKVGTTRNLSTAMDAMKVDITTEDPQAIKKFGLIIQAKNSTNTVPYPKLLKQMEPAVEKFGGVPIVYHKQTQRVGEANTGRFMTRGEYISMNAPDFEVMFTKLRLMEEVYAEVMTYFDSFSEDTQKELNAYLSARNL